MHDDELGASLPLVPAIELRGTMPYREPERVEAARNLLSDLEPDLQAFIKERRHALTEQLRQRLATNGEEAQKHEERRYQSRQGEVSTLIAENTLGKLEGEIRQLKQQRQQGLLFESQSQLDELDRSVEAKEQELERRRRHYDEVREQLARERERITRFVLPRRYALRGDAQVFPVAVEIRLPGGEGGERRRAGQSRHG